MFGVTLAIVVTMLGILINVALVAINIKIYTEWVKEKKYRA